MDNKTRIHVCAPLDLSEQLLFWDYQGTSRPHEVNIARNQALGVELTEETFDPAIIATETNLASSTFLLNSF